MQQHLFSVGTDEPQIVTSNLSEQSIWKKVFNDEKKYLDRLENLPNVIGIPEIVFFFLIGMESVKMCKINLEQHCAIMVVGSSGRITAWS